MSTARGGPIFVDVFAALIGNMDVLAAAGVQRLAVVGPVAYAEAEPGDAVELAVEMAPGADLGAVQDMLRSIVGHPVTIVPWNDIDEAHQRAAAWTAILVLPT